MLVAIQGCCHGSLSAIYDSVAKYESNHQSKVDLLLLCGDFQALRNKHDFASLAVPPKYHNLGSFHEYYSGQRVAPVLTLVIGGNHEASNYMWELYHGGWLAPNIYYLGAAGCVRVEGLRVVGASGIYKGHDYRKGYFETVPYDNSTMRSIYHIRQYDIARLLQLSVRDDTIVMSHDWPLTIAKHGDLPTLLRRKPFFKSEIASNTLGSPPLLQLMKHIQPAHWFSAHLHVKFAALFDHSQEDGGLGGTVDVGNGHRQLSPSTSDGMDNTKRIKSDISNGIPVNPDEIAIDDDDDEDTGGTLAVASDASAPLGQPGAEPLINPNPDEIAIDEDEDVNHGPTFHLAQRSKSHDVPTNGNPDKMAINDDNDEAPSPMPTSILNLSKVSPEEAQAALAVDEGADLVEAARHRDSSAAQGVIGSNTPAKLEQAPETSVQPEAGPSRKPRLTKFLALDKCGPGKDFIQFLDIPLPAAQKSTGAPRITFDTEWLAITRVYHHYLSLEMRQKPMPDPDHLAALIKEEIKRIEKEGLLVPVLKSPGEGDGEGAADENGGLSVEKGEIDIGRVQKFWPTAPVHGAPGGSPCELYSLLIASMARRATTLIPLAAWYTNPQTEAFCGMLGLPNKINPAPQAQPV